MNEHVVRFLDMGKEIHILSIRSLSCALISALCIALFTLLTGCSTPLIHAAGKGDIATINKLLESGVDVNEKDSLGFSALMEAAVAGRIDVVRLLLDSGADVNDRGVGNRAPTVLHFAAWRGHATIVRILLDAGADPGIANNGGKTPSLIAQSRGHTTIVHMLREAEEKRYLANKRPDPVIPKEVSSTVSLTPLQAIPPDMTAGSLDFGFYYALVVGNNDYKHLPKLQTAINDAKTIANLFQNKYGFKVRLLINASRADILLAINAYRRTLTIHDNLLIYYAGHGWLDKDADQGYWLPVDATRENKIEWISNSTITSEIRAIKAKHVMIVADSCYSGKLSRGLQITQKTPDYLAQISRKKARVVLSSGGLEPVMDSGGKGNHSVFASAFIEALGENNGVLDGTTLFTKIREQVGWNADQIPEYSNIHKAGHDGGDFIFVRNK